MRVYTIAPWQERFWAKVDRRGPDECWKWTAQLTVDGYGRFWLRAGTMRLAHRVAYEELVGPIPEGLTLDHLCRNRACVNPGHSEPVSMGVNVLRGQTFTAANARKTHCKQGHPFDEANTYRPRSDPGRRMCRACGLERARAAYRLKAAS